MYKYRGSATLTPPLLEGLHTLAPPLPPPQMLLDRRNSKLLHGSYEVPTGRYLLVNVSLLFDNDKVSVARKLWKKQEENPVVCTGEGKKYK